MIIRKAIIDDFLQIAALDREAWRQNRNSEFIPDGEHVWRHWIDDALLFVAETGGEVVGVILAFPSLKGTLCLHKIFVASNRRGEGIGQKLLEALLSEIDRHGQACYLTVDPENSTAITLYRKLGFTDERLVEGYYRPDEDRLVLTRPARHNPHE